MGQKKVITYGTFDLFHQGHYNILKRAREYGDYLIVGVTGENYDVGRGKLSVHDSLADRIENVKKTGLADEIIVEEYLGQKISDIVRYGVDTFVIGDDWKGKFDHLDKYCDMVYLERTAGISSTKIRKETFRVYRIGIITDDLDDNTIVSESKLINGFKVTSVYAEDEELRKAFRERYDIPESADSCGKLFEQADIVYIRCSLKNRSRFIRKALEAGKHVICDPPFTISSAEQEELRAMARDKNCILMDNVKMVHIHVFNQLLWMTQGGLINIIEFASLDFKYDSGRAVINVGNRIRTKSRIEIVGTKGTIRMDNRWWKGSYFELDNPDAVDLEIYNTNYQGNGFKYLLKSIATMLENERFEPMGLFPDESMEIVRIAEMTDRP